MKNRSYVEDAKKRLAGLESQRSYNPGFPMLKKTDERISASIR